MLLGNQCLGNFEKHMWGGEVTVMGDNPKVIHRCQRCGKTNETKVEYTKTDYADKAPNKKRVTWKEKFKRWLERTGSYKY